MRKLEAVTKEIVDELGYLQRREMRMRDTNGGSSVVVISRGSPAEPHREHQRPSQDLFDTADAGRDWPGSVASE